MNTSEYNNDVEQWARQMASLLKSNLRTMTNEDKHRYLKAKNYVRLAASIKSRTFKRFGEVERVVFPFAKHGFFLAVGASRGHRYKTNPRKAVPWFDFVFESGIDQLQDIILKYKADAYLNAFHMGMKKISTKQ